MISFHTKIILLFIVINIHSFTRSMDPPSPSSIEISNKNTIRTDGFMIRKLAWSPDGNYFAGAQNSREIPSLIIWDATGKKIDEYLSLFDSINGLAFSPDSKNLAATGYSYSYDLQSYYNPHFLKIIARATGTLKLCSKQYKYITCFSYNNDGTKIAIGTEEAKSNFLDKRARNVTIIDSQTGEGTILKRDCSASAVAYSTDGKILAISESKDEASTISLLDITSGTQLKIIYPQIIDSIVFLQFYHDDSSKLISHSRTHCFLWDLKTDRLIHNFNKGDADSTHFTGVALSKNNKTLITTKHRNCEFNILRPKEPYHCITMFDRETGKIIREWSNENVAAMACSPDMKKMAIAYWMYTNMVTLANDEENTKRS
jgi:WD40 repeat protein